MIGNALVALGVSSDAGLAKAGTGLRYAPSSVDGLASVCACSGWSLLVGGAPLVESVETFTFTPVGASSMVRVQDAAGTQLRVTHDFHPAIGSTNLYEVLVTIENLGTAPVQPVYSRTIGWSGLPDLAGLPIVPALWTQQPTADGLWGAVHTRHAGHRAGRNADHAAVLRRGHHAGRR